MNQEDTSVAFGASTAHASRNLATTLTALVGVQALRARHLFCAAFVSLGLARQLDESPALTQLQAIAGTPHYLAPEQIQDGVPGDARTDIYAFGVILYEALTGQLPHSASSYSALIFKIGTTRPPRPRELDARIPPALEAIVQRAIAPDPRRRYPSIESLSEALEHFLAAQGVAGSHAPHVLSRSDAGRRIRIAWSVRASRWATLFGAVRQ